MKDPSPMDTENPTLTPAEKAWDEQLGIAGTAEHKPTFLAGFEAGRASLSPSEILRAAAEVVWASDWGEYLAEPSTIVVALEKLADRLEAK